MDNFSEGASAAKLQPLKTLINAHRK